MIMWHSGCWPCGGANQQAAASSSSRGRLGAADVIMRLKRRGQSTNWKSPNLILGLISTRNCLHPGINPHHHRSSICEPPLPSQRSRGQPRADLNLWPRRRPPTPPPPCLQPAVWWRLLILSCWKAPCVLAITPGRRRRGGRRRVVLRLITRHAAGS